MDHPADIVIRFGERVRQLRGSKGWIQEDFAAKSGLPRPYFADIERGAVSVGLRNLEVIAKTLGVTVSELTEGIDSKSSEEADAVT